MFTRGIHSMEGIFKVLADKVELKNPTTRHGLHEAVLQSWEELSERKSRGCIQHQTRVRRQIVDCRSEEKMSRSQWLTNRLRTLTYSQAMLEKQKKKNPFEDDSRRHNYLLIESWQTIRKCFAKTSPSIWEINSRRWQ
ncbi:Hypothetical predicted protein [Octopus vulgaris]|uniref:Uncharacterized protein n=1 Tax=Octopus vulgaris TaxID=6645 RepID=A0AA36BCM2_OCTVU|nr:Hypothetical predicted protein [Octopus vulgaris]